MKRGTPRHPKLRDLCDQLNCTLALAVGYLELLWHFTAEFAPQGDIGKYSDKRIEGAVDWHKSTGGLVKALVTSGWLDPDPEVRLTVHDWHQHADEAVRKRLSRAGLPFLTDRRKVTGQRTPVSGTVADNGSLPEPEPKPEPEVPTPTLAPVREMPRPKEAPSWEEINEGWKWYQREFPGEVNEFTESRLFISVMETPADLAALRENLPIWKQSQKWIDGFNPSSENFLSKRVFRIRPKARDTTQQPQKPFRPYVKPVVPQESA